MPVVVRLENESIAESFQKHFELLWKINEKLFTAFASEKSLAKDWNSKEEQKAWKNL